MNVLLIEDERPAANRLRQLVLDLLPMAKIFGHLDSISSAVEWLQIHPVPDLIFCDIQLADGLSFEIFERVKISSPIIFTTAFDQYAIKAFKLNSVDYLLKPIDPKELSGAIDKFQKQQIKSTIDLNQIRDLLQPQSKNTRPDLWSKSGEDPITARS